MTKRQYGKYKLRGSPAGTVWGQDQTIPVERLEKHEFITEIELAVAALRSDAGDDRAAAVLPVCLLKPFTR